MLQLSSYISDVWEEQKRIKFQSDMKFDIHTGLQRGYPARVELVYAYLLYTYTMNLSRLRGSSLKKKENCQVSPKQNKNLGGISPMGTNLVN